MQKILFVLPLAIFLIAGCTATLEGGTEFFLSIEDSFFARMDDSGTLIPVDEPVFTRGEEVSLVLINVGPFKPDETGTHWFDIDLKVVDPEGDVVINEQGLLGDEGKRKLDRNIASSPFAAIPTRADVLAGVYTATMTIRDRIGTGSASVTKQFTLT